MSNIDRRQGRMKSGITVLALSLIAAAPASAEHLLTPHIAEYKIKVKFLSGRLHTEVRQTEEGYSAQSVLRASGLASIFVRGDVVESSDFSTSSDGVRPRAVVLPASTEEVSAVVSALHAEGIEVIPRGAGTGLS